MDDRELYLTKFRRILWYQANNGINCPDAEALYRELAPAMRLIAGLEDFIHSMFPRLAQDGHWLPGKEPPPEAFAPAPAPPPLLREEPARVLGATCKFCGARMRPGQAPQSWRCEADDWHSFWINKKLPKGRQGVWMGHKGSTSGPTPDWAHQAPTTTQGSPLHGRIFLTHHA